VGLFVRMVREEYRLHADLFGSGRFGVFPVFVALLVGGGGWLLGQTGVGTGAVVAGVHALVVFFGLQVGTIGLVGRDAMRDVLGDVTLLVFSARTLPVTWRRLLATFLLKDLVYYVALFVTPVVLGLAPLLFGAGEPVATVALLWVTVAGTFALGSAASLTLAGLAGRSKLLAVALVLGLVGLFVAGVDVVAVSPYALFLDPTPATAVVALAPTAALAALAPLSFEPGQAGGRQVRRVEGDTYDRLAGLFGDDRLGSLTARPLLEVARSSGSVWKVAFSLGVLFAVAAFLLDRVTAATAISPSPGVAFGALLGLGSFTTYNWVTSLDDPREYLRYPVGTGAVLAGKRRAYLLLTLPTGVGYLALAAVWYPLPGLLPGLLVFPAVAVYVYGLTAFLTGLSPNELLFDTPLFAAFGAGLALVAVPLLVCSLAAGRYPVGAHAVAVVVAGLAGLVGVLLARRSGPRVDDRLRGAT